MLSHEQLFKQLRRLLAGSKGMRTRNGVRLALDILETNGVEEISVRDKFGFDVHLSTRDKVIASTIIRQGHYSFELMQLLADALHKHDLAIADKVFVNVGANIGTSCINAYQIGFRRIIAVEPDSLNFDLLRKNVVQLADADVRLANVAAGEREEIATLHQSASNRGAHSLLPHTSGRAKPTGQVPVQVQPLPLIVGDVGPFVLLADVEGFEPQLIRGGCDLLLEACVAMCLELTPSRYGEDQRNAVIGFLTRFSNSFIHVPSGTVRATRALADTIGAQPKGHFDVILVNERLAAPA